MNKTEYTDDILIELIQIIPDFLWVVFGTVVFYLLYNVLKRDIFPNMKSISAYGIEIKLLSKTMDSIIDVADKHPNWELHISDKDKKNAIKRAQTHHELFSDTFILWFDDRPETLVNEIKMFSQLGVDVEVASTLEDVLVKMKNQKFDIVISDIYRGDEDKNGVETLTEIVKNGYHIPTIFYIGEYLRKLGTPPYAFGITNRPDELLHLVLDVLERRA